MNQRSLNKLLKSQAIEKGLCEQWQQDWKDGWNRSELISRFKEGLDFCIKNDWPDKHFIRKNFSQDILRDNAVLVDDIYSLLNERICVLIGESKSNIRYNGHNAGTVFIRHNSTAWVSAKAMAFCIVHLYDNATVSCEATDKAMVLVIKHGQDVTIAESKGYVKVKGD